MAHPGGRPTLYTPELVDKIIDVISTTPHGLIKTCSLNKWMPDHQTIKNWLVKYDEFFARYLVAKERQAVFITDNLWEEADNLAGKEEADLFDRRFRFHQWHLSKLAPKQFGDKKEIKQEMNVNVHEDRLGHLK